MKKYIAIFIMIFLFFIVNNSKEKTAVSVFSYNEAEMLLINVVIPNLNTNNFNDYFDDSTIIIGIYPKINMLYKDKIGNMFYSFNKNNIKNNLNSFIKYYKSVLKKNNFVNDLVLSDYSGINIWKVKVYVNSYELNDLLNKCSGCTYEKISS